MILEDGGERDLLLSMRMSHSHESVHEIEIVAPMSQTVTVMEMSAQATVRTVVIGNGLSSNTPSTMLSEIVASML
jgi:hypothetical protein